MHAGTRHRVVTAHPQRVEVAIVDAKRKVDGLAVMIDAGGSYYVAAPHAASNRGGHRRQVRVGRAHPAPVVNRHREHPGYSTCECHDSICCGAHLRARRRGKVDAPVTTVRARRTEACDDRTVDRTRQYAGEGHHEREENSGHQCVARRWHPTDREEG